MLNWGAIGAIADLVAATGVIASLLYLAAQVRASTVASSVEAKLVSTRLLNDFMDSLIENPELNDLYLRGVNDLGLLSGEEEYFRFSNMSLKAFWYFSAGHFQFKSGSLSEEEFHEVRSVLRYWLRGAGCRAWWAKIGRESMSPAFREFVENEIQQVDTP